MNLFWEIHSGLPQEGPGDDNSTLKALALTPDIPSNPSILDIACGPGRQTIALAKQTSGQIIALDNHQPFLEDVEKRAKVEGLSNSITLKRCSMADLDFDKNSFDIIWSEGAIYIMGFDKGLEYWKRFVKPGGAVAVTEASWLADNPPDELRKFWHENYPAMKSVDENLKIIDDLDYSLLGHFTLPESSWADYYQPIEKRIAELRVKYAGDKEALKLLDDEQAEIDLYHKYHDFYGYVFFVMRKPD